MDAKPKTWVSSMVLRVRSVYCSVDGVQVSSLVQPRAQSVCATVSQRFRPQSASKAARESFKTTIV